MTTGLTARFVSTSIHVIVQVALNLLHKTLDIAKRAVASALPLVVKVTAGD